MPLPASSSASHSHGQRQPRPPPPLSCRLPLPPGPSKVPAPRTRPPKAPGASAPAPHAACPPPSSGPAQEKLSPGSRASVQHRGQGPAPLAGFLRRLVGSSFRRADTSEGPPPPGQAGQVATYPQAGPARWGVSACSRTSGGTARPSRSRTGWPPWPQTAASLLFVKSRVQRSRRVQGRP